MNKQDAYELYLKDPQALLKKTCPPKDSIINFIKQYAPRAVIGLSGGVDSALVAALAVEALGNDKVKGLMLPSGNQPEDLILARQLADLLKIEYEVINLAPLTETFSNYSTFFNNKLELGNLKARLRMIHLYALARQFGALVLGTGNRSEIMVGYFTKYGDGGTDILPLGRLFKTQVWALAHTMNMPQEIIERPPSAGLWPGQTDEGEIGVLYPELDQIILGYELGFNVDRIQQVTSIAKAKIEKVLKMIISSEHKRKMPPLPAPVFTDSKKSDRPAPTLAVDAIIKYNDNYILIKRKYQPFKDHLALPGGHVEYNQTTEQAVIREVKEETGLDFQIRGLLGVYSEPKRDPRGHYVSVVFYGKGTGKLKAGDDAKEAFVCEKSEIKNLAFDHYRIWQDYRKLVNE